MLVMYNCNYVSFRFFSKRVWYYSVDLSELDWNVPGYLGHTRGNIGQEIVDVASQNKIYEVILRSIWGTMMILNLQFKIKSVNK